MVSISVPTSYIVLRQASPFDCWNTLKHRLPPSAFQRLLKSKFPMEIEKVYEPQRFEPHWAKWWEESKLFRVEPRPGEPYFSLSIPPPNVTGSLHIGHMFEHSIIDAHIRWR